jgi:GDP-4-dehydro-6-deoxy-D-mannose reductase
MRLLVTGATGFVGRHLCAYLAAAGHEMAGTYWDDHPDASLGTIPCGELVEMDLADRRALDRFIARVEPEAVVHLAGLSHVGGSWRRLAEYFRVNTLGAENVAAAAHDAGVRRVLLASSAEVYGAVPEGEQPLTEDRPVAPGSPYAMTKAAAERIALARAPEAAVVVRAFNLIGPGQAKRFALPSFAAQLAEIRAERRPPVLAVGNLAARRDFVHVADAVRALTLLACRGEVGTVYNLASGRDRSIAEALEALIEVSGTNPRVERDPERLRPVDQPLLVGDASRLRALGWTEELGFERAIRDLWDEAVEATEAPEAGEEVEA